MRNAQHAIEPQHGRHALRRPRLRADPVVAHAGRRRNAAAAATRPCPSRCTQVFCTCAEITSRPSRSSASSFEVGCRQLVVGVHRQPGTAIDVGAAGAELLLQPLETAVEVIDAIDRRLALGASAGDHQRDRGAQIRRHHRRAAQPVDAVDDRRIALELDMGAEARQLLHVHEAILENGLGDARRAPRARHQRHELRLQIGRETRERRGRDIDRRRCPRRCA